MQRVINQEGFGLVTKDEFLQIETLAAYGEWYGPIAPPAHPEDTEQENS